MMQTLPTLRAVVALGLVTSTAAVAACGSSSTATSTGTTSSAASSATSATVAQTSSSGTSGPGTSAPYAGSESKVPSSYAQPTIKKGTKCVIGYDNPIAMVSSLEEEQRAAGAAAQQLGCRFIATDAGGVSNTQVSNINNLLVRGITALISYPLDPNALQPVYNRAAAMHIPIVALNTPGIVGAKLAPGVSTQVIQGFDRDAWDTMQNLAKAKPGASFTVIGYAAPVPSLNNFVTQLIAYGRQFGLKYLGKAEEAATATPQDDQSAATALVSKYPTMDALVAFNDATALVAASVARTEGHSNILVTGSNGETPNIKAVEAGQLLSTFSFQWADLGKQAAWAAYDLLTKQHLPLPAGVNPPGVLVTKANASTIHGV